MESSRKTTGIIFQTGNARALLFPEKTGAELTPEEAERAEIYKYFDEINETPVVYRWAWNLNDIDTSHADRHIERLL